jgi:hypothetical protein
MKRAEREAIMRQGVTLPETPRSRRQLAGLAEDLEDSPAAGRRLPLRLRNFRHGADHYLSALTGPRAYMVRLRRIDSLIQWLEASLADARADIARESAGDPSGFARRWRDMVATWDFGEVNDLIERHNRWYPVESRLPMDPARRDYALVNGKDYRRPPLDEEWVLERFPAGLD